MGGLDLDSRSSGCARLFNDVRTREAKSSLGLKQHRRGLVTPPEATNTGPGLNRGSGGGARGCGFEERVGAHARAEGQLPILVAHDLFLSLSLSLSMFGCCVCVP